MNRSTIVLAVLFVLGLAGVCAPVRAQVSAVPQLMNFQGRLAKPDGTPVSDGNYLLKFTLFDAVTAGTQKWTQTLNPVAVHNGVFAVLLSGFPAGTFNGNLWLEIKVGNDPPLTPRQQLVTVAYAFKAGSVPDASIGSTQLANGAVTTAKIASGAVTAAQLAPGLLNSLSWLLGGNSGTTSSNFLGTTDNQPLELRSNNWRAMRYSYAQNTATMGSEFRSMNVLGGSSVNTIAAGVVGGTIAGGGKNGFNSTNAPNDLRGDFGVIGGGLGNLLYDLGDAILGGSGNIGQGKYSAIGGGSSNNTQGDYTVIAGGQSNYASGVAASVGGGQSNTASGTSSTAGGGIGNIASGNYSTVSGGESNTASNYYSTVCGGDGNIASEYVSTVGGGLNNVATGDSSTVGGGQGNTASAADSTVSGGFVNMASATHSTVGGGYKNTASGFGSTASGGLINIASGYASTVSGGNTNTASGSFSTVGGGEGNTASGNHSTVGGGYGNSAMGVASFAAGSQALASHSGAFVWNAGSNGSSFSSTAPNQFCIRSTGGIVLEQDVSPTVYTASNPGEYNRYLQLINSPQTPNASGLKAGGILCADNYGYSNPGKNDMTIKGRAALGFDVNATGYTFAVNGSIYCIGFTNASDVRWKRNIASFDHALEAILNLHGVTFDWKPTGGMRFPEGRQIGFIAQEVEQVLPELVTTDQNGYKSVAYQNVVPVLVEAVKQQQQQMDAREKRLTALEAENARLKSRLDALEAAMTDIVKKRNAP